MLASRYRPDGIVTVYLPDFTLSVIEAQLKALSTDLEALFTSGSATLSTQVPTDTLCGTLKLTVTGLVISAEKLNDLVVTAATDLDVRMRHVEFDIDSNTVEFLVETYQPSAYRNETSYAV